MKTLRVIAIIALLLPAFSCVPIPSIYPLWDEQHSAFEPTLVGVWTHEDPDSNFTMSIAEAKAKTYLITATDKEKNDGKVTESRYATKLVRLEKHLFLDLNADEASIDKSLESEVYPATVLMHFFARLELDGDTIKLAMLDDEKFSKKVLEKKIDLPIIKRDSTILLTAETAKIQQVLSRIAEDKDFWDDDMVLHRAPAR